jgi:hypothetical protein
MTGGHLNGSASSDWRETADRDFDDFSTRWETDDEEIAARGEAPPHPAYDDVGPRFEGGRAKDRQRTPREDPLPIAAVWRGVDPSKIPRRRWLLGHVLCRGIVSVLVSPGGIGKSSLALTEAIQMATGRQLLGHALPRGAVRVWVNNLEDSLEELNRRAAAVCKHHDIPYEALADRLFMNSGIDAPLKLAGLTTRGQAHVDEEAFEHLEGQLTANKIDVIIVDPFISSHSLPENDNTMIDRLAKRWAQLAFRCDVAVLLVHHTKKGPPGFEHDAESARGAKAMVDASRSVRVLNPMSKDEATELGVREESRRLYFRASIDKQNLAPPAAERNWYRLASVNLENGTPPLQMDADFVGVPERWTPPQPEELVAAGDLARVQDAIEAGDFGFAVQASDWVGNVIAQVLGMPAGDKFTRTKIKRLIAMWEAMGALRREEVYSEKSRRNRQVMRVGRREEVAVAQ